MSSRLGNELRTSIGKIHFAKEVIATLAGLAAVECYGLVGMVPRKIRDEIVEILGRENLSQGVEIFAEQEQLVINLYVVVSYGTRIPEVALNVIEKVKYTVERYTGLTVSHVNVNIEGVR